MKASVFLPSFNKPDYVVEALCSVIAQTHQDWECWLLENSTDRKTRQALKRSGLLDDKRIIYRKINIPPKVRAVTYPTSWLLNRFYPLATGEAMFYLSDDDLLEPECFKTCTDYFAKHPDRDVISFGLRTMNVTAPRQPSGPQPCLFVSARDIAHKDHGSIAFRKRCLGKLEGEFFHECMCEKAAISDSLFMASLKAAGYRFYFIDDYLVTKQYTPESCWWVYDEENNIRVPGRLRAW